MIFSNKLRNSWVLKWLDQPSNIFFVPLQE